MEEIFRIEPPVSLRIIGRKTAFEKFQAPFRFVSITASQSSSFIRIIRVSRVIPALFTRKSIVPNSFCTCLTNSADASVFATSHCAAKAFTFKPSISAFSRSASSALFA
jgi:hypothetical protein